MAGTTGKRAKAPGKCFRCGRQIDAVLFERSREGDSHVMSPDGKYACVNDGAVMDANGNKVGTFAIGER